MSGYLRCWTGGRWRAAMINPATRRPGDPATRSRCVGCAFCPTGLETCADPPLRLEGELHGLLDGLQRQLPPGGSLRELEEITVSTACYRSEDAALEALLVLRKVCRSRGLTPRLGLLSSVVRSREAFRFIAQEIAPFLLILTADCAGRRDLLLKNTKADLLPEAMPALLAQARARGWRRVSRMWRVLMTAR